MLYDCLVIVIAKLYCSGLVASYIHFINLKQIILFLAGKWLDVCWENCTCIVNKSIFNILWEQGITSIRKSKFPLHVTGIRGPHQHSLLWRHDPTPRMRRAKLEGDEAALPIDGPWQPGSHPVPGLPIRPATVQCQSGGGRVFPPIVVLRQELERNDCLQWLYQGLPPESLRDGHLRNLINRTNFSADKSAFFSCFVFYSLQWSFWQWRCRLAILSADVPMYCLCTIYLVRELAIKICIPPICSLILPQFQR